MSMERPRAHIDRAERKETPLEGVPEFPQFKSLEVSDKARIDAYTAQFDPYSDFNFTSLWSWDTNGERAVSTLNGNLVARVTDYSSGEPFYSFLGTRLANETAQSLLDATPDSQRPLQLVPEISASALSSENLKVTEDRDHFDYIYDVPQLARFEDSAYRRRRQAATRFVREHAGATMKFMDLGDYTMREHMMKVIESWEADKRTKGDERGFEHEREALKRLFETAREHSVLASAVYEGDTMLGFSIDELLTKNDCMGHFWKADTRNTGVYEFMCQRIAQHLESLGYERWNWEQDLGDEKMRASKSGFRPAQFLKKYSVTRV